MSDHPSGTTSIDPDVRWRVITLAIAVGALIVALVAFGTSGSNDSKIAEPSSDSIQFDVELGDFFIKPSSIDVPAGAIITLRVSNIGNIPHDLVVSDSQGTEMLDSGSSQTITVGPFDASVEALCSVSGHKEAGMTMAINVVGAAVASSNGGDTNAGGDGTADEG